LEQAGRRRINRVTGKTKLIGLSALILAGIGAGVWGFLTLSRGRTFPSLPEGSYSGTISGLAEGSANPATLFLERYKDSNLFLIVAFLDGFKPQAVRLQEQSADRLYPLNFTFHGAKFELSGASAQQLSGSVRSSDGRKGRWELSPQNTGITPIDERQLMEVLSLRKRIRGLRETMKAVSEELNSKIQKRDRLQELVADERALKERVEEQRAAIAAELQSGIEERKDTAKVVADLVAELDLRERISPAGRGISAARRIARRENKWFDVQWGGQSGAEEEGSFLAENPEVDLARLEQAAKRAAEIQGLLRERDAEAERIRKLEQQLLEPRRVAPPSLQQPQPRPEEAPKSLWDKLFG
jgi:hypothetical protein